jgi:hypothetical protein
VNKTHHLSERPEMIAACATRDELRIELARIDAALTDLAATTAKKAEPTSTLDRALRAIRGEVEVSTTDDTTRAELHQRKGLVIDGLAEADKAVQRVATDQSAAAWRERVPAYLKALDGLIAAYEALAATSLPFEQLSEEMFKLGLNSNAASTLPLDGRGLGNLAPKAEALRQAAELRVLRFDLAAWADPAIGSRRCTVKALTDIGGFAPGSMMPTTIAEACQLRRAGRVEMLET